MGKLFKITFAIAVTLFAADAVRAADFDIPAQLTAGQELTVTAPGSGTLYLVGPNNALKQSVKQGEQVTFGSEDLRAAGKYRLVLSDGSDATSKEFFVTAAEPGKVSFLARPSRVPVSRPDVISGVAFAFDEYRNLVLKSVPVNFEITVGGQKLSRSVPTRYGVAYLKLPSASREGAAQFVASVGSASERRVVQQVASEPCSISMRSRRAEKAIILETAPIRDCSGNAVPDGTIVTFTHVGPKGRSTIDARIKKGIATAQLPLGNPGRVSVASGVVMGNEIMVGGQ